MNQLIVYLSVNAGLLAMFARLWAIDRKLKSKVARHGVFTARS
jgi:hypothetical protein